ncbi:hypothetical protein IAU60_004649 [Kwoniella sp. DSM 27419]
MRGVKARVWARHRPRTGRAAAERRMGMMTVTWRVVVPTRSVSAPTSTIRSTAVGYGVGEIEVERRMVRGQVLGTEWVHQRGYGRSQAAHTTPPTAHEPTSHAVSAAPATSPTHPATSYLVEHALTVVIVACLGRRVFSAPIRVIRVDVARRIVLVPSRLAVRRTGGGGGIRVRALIIKHFRDDLVLLTRLVWR